MRLSTRLFLFVAILLLLLSLAVYLVPIYLLNRNTREERKRYLSGMEKERSEAHKRYSDWISEEIATHEASINAFLYLIAAHSDIQGELLKTGKVTESVWLRSSKLLSYSDQLTFMEVEEQNASAAITLSRTRLYLARQFPIQKDIAWVAIGSIREPEDEHIYLGVWLSTARVEADSYKADEEEVPQIFLLFDPSTIYHKGSEYSDRLKRYDKWLEGPGKETPALAHDLSKSLFTRLESAREYLIQEFGDPDPAGEKRLHNFVNSLDRNLPESLSTPAFSPYMKRVLGELRAETSFLGRMPQTIRRPSRPGVSKTAEFYTSAFLAEVRRINNLELISALGYLSSGGAIYEGPFDKDAPVGAARLLSGDRAGTAVLSAQAFSSKRLFEAANHLERYPSDANEFDIASQFALVDGAQVGALTVANVLLLGAQSGEKVPTYLTLGASLNQVLSRLSQITGETALLVYHGNVVAQVDAPGITLNVDMRTSLKDQIHASTTRGFITLDDTQFYYTRYNPDPNWDAAFITLELGRTLTAPIQQFEARSKELTLEVSRRIIAVAVGVFVIALVILELLARHFTRPIRQLAAATQDVAEGRLEAVRLPRVPARSKNEVTILTHAFEAMIQKMRDREKLRAVLDKVVSKEIADEILKGRIHLGGEVRELTVFFADIRGFSSITENLPPDEVIVFINSYMTVMTEVIEDYQGVVDKYVGDEVMALFGAPLAHPHSSLQAVLAALVMRERLHTWNQARAGHGLVTADVGIGINTGEMVAGNMGAEDRLNYTVMGANVNLASRLCQEAASGEILIVEELLWIPELAKTLEVEEKTIRTFKGFSHPKKVYRVIGLKAGFDLQQLSDFVQKFDASGPLPWEKDR